MAEIFDWLAPAPFWEEGNGLSGNDLLRPAILQFQTDQFMNQFLATANAATPAGWQTMQSWVASDSPTQPLKLYQPFHGTYYLICASLCCRLPAFPDRRVRRAEGESIYCVLRKIDASGSELGWSVAETSKRGLPAPGDDQLLPPTGAWVPLSKIENEERIPLFTSSPTSGRSLVYGYIPVSSRETQDHSFVTVDSNLADASIQLMMQFDENISRPLAQYIAQSASLLAAQKQEFALFLLLDLADFLRDNLPNVFASIQNQASNKEPESEILYPLLDKAQVTDSRSAGTVSANKILKDVIQKRKDITDLKTDQPLPLILGIDITTGSSKDAWNDLHNKTQAALDARKPLPVPVKPAPERTEQISKLAVLEGERFQLRCVYERPCDAPFPTRRYISEPTCRFDLSGIFDMDAPARPIRIEMPADVSIAAMRKFKKSVGFALSNAMRGKMAMVVGHEQDLLNGKPPGQDPKWGVGMICSFSIQIVFIVAFFLLLIFVFVFNIIFFWMAFFRICLPYPKKS